MKGGLSISWVLLLFLGLGLAGCPEKKAGEDVHPKAKSEGQAKAGGPGLLVELTRPGKDKVAGMQIAIAKRLDAFGIRGARIQAEGEKRIRIRRKGADIRQVDDMRKLLFEIPKIDISPVERGEEFFAELKSKLPAGGGFRVGVDEFGDARYGKVVKISYVAADDAQALQTFVAKVETPPKTRLAPMLGAAGAMALLLPDPPPMENVKFFHVQLIRDEDGKASSVKANLAKPFLDDFKDLIDRSLHRPLAVLVNGQVRALPVIWKRRAFGDIHFVPSSLAEPAQVEKEASRLAAALRNFALMGRLKFISQEADK